MELVTVIDCVGQQNMSGQWCPIFTFSPTHTCLPATPSYENVVIPDDLSGTVSSPDIPGMVREDDQVFEHTLYRAVENHENVSDPEMLAFKVSVVYCVRTYAVEHVLKVEWGNSQVWAWLGMIEWKNKQASVDYM